MMHHFGTPLRNLTLPYTPSCFSKHIKTRSVKHCTRLKAYNVLQHISTYEGCCIPWLPPVWDEAISILIAGSLTGPIISCNFRNSFYWTMFYMQKTGYGFYFLQWWHGYHIVESLYIPWHLGWTQPWRITCGDLPLHDKTPASIPVKQVLSPPNYTGFSSIKTGIPTWNPQPQTNP